MTLFAALLLLIAPSPAPKLPPEPAPHAARQFVVTPETDCRLDGRACAFAEGSSS